MIKSDRLASFNFLVLDLIQLIICHHFTRKLSKFVSFSCHDGFLAFYETDRKEDFSLVVFLDIVFYIITFA
jgi:hypothetical protein